MGNVCTVSYTKRSFKNTVYKEIVSWFFFHPVRSFDTEWTLLWINILAHMTV